MVMTERRKHRKAAGDGSEHAVAGSQPSVLNLDACVQDAREAALDSDPGPPEPTNYHQLRGRLQAAQAKFPPLYRQAVVDPFIQQIDQLGQDGFTQLLVQDPGRQAAAGLMLDIAQAILQKGEGYNEKAIDAFQQVASDLYDGFLSAEDRKAVQPPENATTPPLVKWGNPDAGPYTWPIDATRSFGLQAAIVSLPPANSRRGLLGWAALGHETGGHDILHAYAGLQDQLATAVRTALTAEGVGHGLPEYWADRIDETSSDVMGILNMGPAAGIGVVGFFRGLNAAFGGEAKLRNDGPASDPHPADVLRGFLAASTVSLLSFSQAEAWQQVLLAETEKDVTTITVAGETVPEAEARTSAEIVARTIVRQQVGTLESHALGDIQDWRDQDEEVLDFVRPLLTTAGPFPLDHSPRIYAAHVVAAAVMVALSGGESLPLLFDRMVAILDAMHAANPSWSPLFVRHPGNLTRAVAYTRARVFSPELG
jgi:hypothetical protein